MAELEQALEQRRAKYIEQRAIHKAKLSESYARSLEYNRQQADKAKQDFATELVKAKQAQLEEQELLKLRTARIAEATRTQVKARHLRSKSYLDNLRSRYDLRLESKLRERDNVQSRVRTRQIAQMEMRERELLERLKVTQLHYANLETNC
jgi:hypothetical protein